MRGIKGRNNRSTELKLRFGLVRSGVRGWTVRPKKVTGNPDFWFAYAKVAVFVDGCFWHGCEACRHIPKSNSSFWAAKFARNRAKDARIAQQLANEGVEVVRFWEHELKADLGACISRIMSVIHRPKERMSIHSEWR